MNVPAIDVGGREYALVYKLNQSNLVERMLVIPGNKAMTPIAEVHTEIPKSDHQVILDSAKRQDVDWVVIGPKQPLISGLADVLRANGFKIFGPNKQAVQIEGSELFAKRVMEKHNTPTADYKEVERKRDALTYIENCELLTTVREDRLVAGKGTIIANTIEAVRDATKIMYGDEKEDTVVFEVFLGGEEFSLMTFASDDLAVPLDCTAQDHRRIFDHNEGPDTGGMGTYCPVPHINDGASKLTNETITQPITGVMLNEGYQFFDVLYIGAILARDGPEVIELSTRFGGPEAQVLLSRMESDLMQHIIDLGKGERTESKWKNEFIVGVMLTSKGYPDAYEKGHKVSGLGLSESYFVNGLKRQGDTFVTLGGKVILTIGESDNAQDVQ